MVRNVKLYLVQFQVSQNCFFVLYYCDIGYQEHKYKCTWLKCCTVLHESLQLCSMIKGAAVGKPALSNTGIRGHMVIQDIGEVERRVPFTSPARHLCNFMLWKGCHWHSPGMLKQSQLQVVWWCAYCIVTASYCTSDCTVSNLHVDVVVHWKTVHFSK